MINRLGFWNRLALVAGALTSLILPTWFILDHNAERAEIGSAGYQACMERASQTLEPNAVDGCWEAWMTNWSFLGWSDWISGVGATLVGCAVLYLLIAAFVWMAKWVWRGRQGTG